MGFDLNAVLMGVVQLLVFWLALSVRESARAWMAAGLGDPGLREAGRISLNPARHVDAVGSGLLPLLLLLLRAPLFGWAKPAPVAWQSLGERNRSPIWVSLAGPVANLLTAAAAIAALAVALRLIGPEARDAALLALLQQYDRAALLDGFPLVFTLEQIALTSSFLAAFQLLPVPPQDGGTILLELLPTEWALRYARISPYGRLIAMSLAIFKVVGLMILPVSIVLVLVINL